MNREEFESEIRNPNTIRKTMAVLSKIGGIDPNDVLQEAWLLAWRGIANFREGSLFSTWFCTIARNVALTELRRQKRLGQNTSIEEADNHATNANGTETRIALQQAIRRAAKRLNKHQQEALYLYLMGMSEVEAAEQLGIPINTYKTRLYHAREALKQAVTLTSK